MQKFLILQSQVLVLVTFNPKMFILDCLYGYAFNRGSYKKCQHIMRVKSIHEDIDDLKLKTPILC